MNDRLMKQVLAKLCGMSTIIIMLAVLIFFAVVNGMNGINFLASENLSVIVNQASFLVIVGIGQAIVILTGGINLSMGAVMAFSSVLCGGMLLKESNIFIGVPIVLVLLTGAATGLLNGVMITKLNIPPFIATFAMMYTCRGWRGCICGTGCYTRSMNRSARLQWGDCLKSGDLQSRCPC